IIGNPSLNHRYRKGFYSLFKTLQQNQLTNHLRETFAESADNLKQELDTWLLGLDVTEK
ncbi:replication initiation factor domain-containing protein, partial [Enterococcus faecium]